MAGRLDGGSSDCGSGLLLTVTRAMRGVPVDEVLVVTTVERSVVEDLPAWARLAGHTIVALAGSGARGPWEVAVRRGASPASHAGTGNAGAGSPDAAAPLGTRLWLYTNFDCNLACDYCCAGSSPGALARRLDPVVATAAVQELAGLGGREVLFTGGEPFLHPELAAMVTSAARHVEVTVLTNAMVFDRGSRRTLLERLPRDGVVLQISLDSPDPGLHDAVRGSGSFDRARAGIALARSLGFRVRVAATLAADLPGRDRVVAGLQALLADDGLPPENLLVRPVAHEGAARAGVELHLEDLAPEPTLTVDGAWWHPACVTNPSMRVADTPLPLSDVLETIAATVHVTQAAASRGRTVFRCT